MVLIGKMLSFSKISGRKYPNHGSSNVFTPEQDNDKTSRQRQKMLNMCIPMMLFTPGLATTSQTTADNDKRKRSNFVLSDDCRTEEGEAAEVALLSDTERESATRDGLRLPLACLLHCIKHSN